MHINEKEICERLIRSDFTSFIHKVFNTINPHSSFIGNWHIELIAEHLKEVEKGHIKRLIINMPPRNLKSVCVSVAWPAWLLGHNPSIRLMIASYSQILSTKLSLDTRFIMNERWYQKLFPQTKLHPKHNQKTKFLTTRYGFRFSTSPGGSATGEGGDILIVDDPHNPAHITSEKSRRKVINWFMETFSSRLNNRQEGKIVLVMQRLHPDDLTGFLLKEQHNEWKVLKIPAFAERKLQFAIGNFRYVMKEGESINSKLFTESAIEKLKNEIGDNGFAAQYLQEPKDLCCGMLNLDYFCYYDQIPISYEAIIQSWDTAIKTGDKADYSVCTTWLISEKKYYLIDCVIEKYEYPQLKKNAMKLAEKYKPHKILIEDKASGQSLIQDLKQENFKNITPCKVTQDKITRYAQILEFFENGKVLFPKNTKNLDIVKRQLTSFPNCKNDDVVDSISQFLNYIKKNRYSGTKIQVRNFSG